MTEKTTKFAFHAEVVRNADPIMPKLDLALENNELKLSRNIDELLQSLMLRILMQRGDYRYDRNMGMPWVDHPRLRETPIMASDMDARNLQRIEILAQREILKNPRVVNIDSVKAEVVDPNRRRVRLLVRATTFDEEIGQLEMNLGG